MTVKVIAEAGTCTGSVEWAHAAIESAAEVGCWGFKTQILTEDLAAVDSPRYDRLVGPRSQREAFANQIPREAWAEVQAHCKEVGLEWFASVWDFEGIDLCESLGVDYYKIGSADITYLDLIAAVANTGKTVFLSTGAADLEEIDEAVAVIGDFAPLVLMACTLSYPCEPEDAYLGRLVVLRSDLVFETAATAWGYSDHTTLTDISGFAVAAGASYLEKHFTITPGQGGDHDFALNPYQMADYVDHADRAYRLLWPNPASRILAAEMPVRYLARRSLHALTDIGIGSPVIIGHNAKWQRPTGGIEPNEKWVGPLVAARSILA